MRKAIIVVLVFLVGCGTLRIINEEEIAKLERVVVVSYTNDTGHPFLTGIVKKELESDLKRITKPKFILYDEACGMFPVDEITRESLKKQDVRERIRKAFGADAVMFCTISKASVSRPSNPEDEEKEGLDVDMETVPTGRPEGGEKVKSISVSFKSLTGAKVSISVEIRNLRNSWRVYWKTDEACISATGRSDAAALTDSATYGSHTVMRHYSWPGLEDE